MPTIPEYDMDDSERYDEGPKTWAFHHQHWTAEAIRDMKASGEWYEDLDAEDEDEDEEDDEDDDEEDEE